jgi:hypothetical protein
MKTSMRAMSGCPDALGMRSLGVVERRTVCAIDLLQQITLGKMVVALRRPHVSAFRPYFGIRFFDQNFPKRVNIITSTPWIAMVCNVLVETRVRGHRQLNHG